MSPRFGRRREAIPVSELGRGSRVKFALILILVVIVGVYFGFTKRIPFKHGFQLKAQFSSAVNIHSKSPVRVAGVDVGKVSSIKREGKTGLVTMEIEGRGLPIHEDATVKIRPRIFLEGNWFVELSPGSPSAKTISSGHTLPLTQTSDPVQLDQVLDALNTDTRANLQKFLIYYGEGLTKHPNAEENSEQLPEVRGINAAEALNKTYRRSPEALRGGAIITQAITGTEQHDFSKLIAGVGKVTSALNVHEQELGELIGNFNNFFESLAVQSSALRATVHELPTALRGIGNGLASLDRSFPPTRAFAKDILPGVKATPETVKALLPWIEQVKASLAPTELGGVAKGLAEATPSLAKLTGEQIPVFKQTEAFNQCLTKVIYPVGNAKLQDGNATSGVENYKEFWYSLVGLSGIGQGFDGNGTFAKFLVGNSGATIKSAPATLSGKKLSGGLQLLARSPLPPQGTRPAFPAEEPPYEPLVPCDTQSLPEFNGPLASGPADGSNP
jgi:phospholipid/cholesterol/gamma-HCH transport system substrate-binding protein